MCTLLCYLLPEFSARAKEKGHVISQRDEVTWELEYIKARKRPLIMVFSDHHQHQSPITSNKAPFAQA
jgi:hypothetical protein